MTLKKILKTGCNFIKRYNERFKRIKGHAGKGTNTPKRGYWKAKYETREKAENALKAYFANK